MGVTNSQKVNKAVITTNYLKDIMLPYKWATLICRYTNPG